MNKMIQQLSVRMIVISLSALAVGGSLFCVQAHAEDSEKSAVDEIDYLALATRLFSDGHMDRAQEALAQVNVRAPGVDLHRYHLLSGLIALRQEKFANAVKRFQAAIKTPPLEANSAEEGKKHTWKPEPQLFYYLAQAHFGAKQYAETLKALDQGGKELLDKEGSYQLRAQAAYAQKKFDLALSTLSQAQKRFPNQPQFERMQVFYLMDLGLYQQATEVGRRYLTRESTDVEDHVAIGEALRRGRSFPEAIVVLQTANLRFPDSDKVLLALAHVYVDLDQKYSAASILEDAARIDPKYTVEAAEMYRQAKRSDLALFLNARVDNQAAKFRQRLSILLDQQRFEMVAGMAPTVERLGLTKDDQIRYAMAYGFYKTGDYQGAERYLRGIADPSLFESASGLRRAMRACEPTDWSCE